jgi:hypothetical protein
MPLLLSDERLGSMLLLEAESETVEGSQTPVICSAEPLLHAACPRMMHHQKRVAMCWDHVVRAWNP